MAGKPASSETNHKPATAPENMTASKPLTIIPILREATVELTCLSRIALVCHDDG